MSSVVCKLGDPMPEMTSMCAHQLRTGDMLAEGRMILTIEEGNAGGDRMVVVELATPKLIPKDPDEPYARDRVEVDNPGLLMFGWCEQLPVARWMLLPNGDHPTASDIWGWEYCWPDGEHVITCEHWSP